MKYNQEMHKEIEAINDMLVALHARVKEFHTVYGDLNKHSAYYCDTTDLDLFADDLDGYQADEVAPILEALRTARDREDELREYRCYDFGSMEKQESSMLRFYQAGIR